MCFLEGGFDVLDCRAQLWVIRKRAAALGVTWLDMAWRHSALRSNTPRALAIRGYPAGDVPGWTARLNRKWAALGVEVRAFFRGERRDPTPRSTHWAGSADTVRTWEVRDMVIKNRFVHERRER